MYRCYSDLIKIDNFEDRCKYLSLNGQVGKDTFGFDRYLNQALYTSPEWKKVRREVIIRDKSCDLAVEGYEIQRNVIIHHMNPITMDDIINHNPIIFDMENLICTTLKTHNAIHYGDMSFLTSNYIERYENDTCPWKKRG